MEDKTRQAMQKKITKLEDELANALDDVFLLRDDLDYCKEQLQKVQEENKSLKTEIEALTKANNDLIVAGETLHSIIVDAAISTD